ncbi:OprO/OprP family phosphate-selective porin [Glacieibacterium frigidum]|uniref:Porin n=1 Tax=Glacieibacterium frigidum TaxID=2593303 RepID=A0A552U8E6_9SPHN|nr:porin [Glacieibacterium frigidum]TRW14459.1 hypothetical protein FMM06_12180 [Glacieibacterium frigidum]
MMLRAVLLLSVAAPALAQDPVAEAVAAAEARSAKRLEALEAKIGALEAEVASLRKNDTAAPPPVWTRGSPEFREPGSGGIFRLTGEAQFDFGYVENPGERVATTNLGYNGRARRIIIGAHGDLPGDFRYIIEFNLTGQAVDYEDVSLAWEPKGSPFSAKIGFHYPFVSLDILTSNKLISFSERAQINDALGQNGRRLGASFGLVDKSGTLRFNAGLFNSDINANFNNTNYLVSARGVWAPKALGGQLHLAANYQYRRFPVQSQGFLYQARPFAQISNVRFIGTAGASATGALSGGIAASGDQVFGVEAAGIFGPLHVVGEANYVKVDAIAPGEVLGNGRASTGQRLEGNPAFKAAYVEAGYWLTGETRGYARGRFDRTRVRNPVHKGGPGAFQLVGRVDHLDLTDRVGGTGAGIVNGVLNGGKQTGYLGGVNWWPTDNIRFSAQYTRAEIDGGPGAGQVEPLSPASLIDRDYGVDVFVTRAQFDF